MEMFHEIASVFIIVSLVFLNYMSDKKIEKLTKRVDELEKKLEDKDNKEK